MEKDMDALMALPTPIRSPEVTGVVLDENGQRITPRNTVSGVSRLSMAFSHLAASPVASPHNRKNALPVKAEEGSANGHNTDTESESGSVMGAVVDDSLHSHIQAIRQSSALSHHNTGNIDGFVDHLLNIQNGNIHASETGSHIAVAELSEEFEAQRSIIEHLESERDNLICQLGSLREKVEELEAKAVLVPVVAAAIVDDHESDKDSGDDDEKEELHRLLKEKDVTVKQMEREILDLMIVLEQERAIAISGGSKASEMEIAVDNMRSAMEKLDLEYCEKIDSLQEMLATKQSQFEELMQLRREEEEMNLLTAEQERKEFLAKINDLEQIIAANSAGVESEVTRLRDVNQELTIALEQHRASSEDRVNALLVVLTQKEAALEEEMRHRREEEACGRGLAEAERSKYAAQIAELEHVFENKKMEVEGQLIELRAVNEEMSAAFETLKASSEQEILALKHLLAEKEQQFESKVHALVEDESSGREAVEAQNRSMTAKLTEMQLALADSANVQNALSVEVGALKQKLASVSAECDESKAAFELLKSEKQEVELKNKDLTASVLVIEERNAHLDRIIADISQRSDNARERYELALAEKEEQIQDYQHKTANLAIYELKIEDLDISLSTMTRELEKKDQHLEDATQQIAHLQQTSAALEQKNTESEAIVQSLSAQIEKYKFEVQSVSSSLVEEQSRCLKLQASTAESTALVASLEATVADLHSNLATKTTALEAAVVAKEAAEHSQLRKIVALEEALRKESFERKRLFNRLQDAKGKIRVFARVRPLSNKEISEAGPDSAAITASDPLTLVVSKPPALPKDFSFDRVFGPQSQQEEVFDEVEGLMKSVVDGYNVCLFAYGQTGAGKSHTMLGNDNAPGIAPRAVRSIFEALEGSERRIRSEVSVSMMELYVDTLSDLLLPVPKGGVRPDLAIKLDSNGLGMSNVPDATRQVVSNAEECLSVFQKGLELRRTSLTQMNSESSRSHLVFSVVVNVKALETGERSIGKLTLIDLAGSERIDKSGTSGIQQKEGTAINMSLTALGDVISSLTRKDKHVPYRNHKLTMLMADSLGGSSKTAMFVNLSPAIGNVDESVTSINYATRVRNVTNDAKKNGDSDQVIKALKSRIQELEGQVGIVDSGEVSAEGADDAINRVKSSNAISKTPSSRSIPAKPSQQSVTVQPTTPRAMPSHPNGDSNNSSTSQRVVTYKSLSTRGAPTISAVLPSSSSGVSPSATPSERKVTLATMSAKSPSSALKKP
eukprot:GDKJ01002970.1.p1 GENE.GDKJ01002970.1~~GDKJ01002970.1.p1  ORF type:complete len:1427 (-),score=472.62 GDKJ01002970.1:172-3924(-)